MRSSGDGSGPLLPDAPFTSGSSCGRRDAGRSRGGISATRIEKKDAFADAH